MKEYGVSVPFMVTSDDYGWAESWTRALANVQRECLDHHAHVGLGVPKVDGCPVCERPPAPAWVAPPPRPLTWRERWYAWRRRIGRWIAGPGWPEDDGAMYCLDDDYDD